MHSPAPRSRKFPLLAGGAIAAAALAAYGNSFSGPFTFDDIGSITENPTILRLWPIRSVLLAPAKVPTGGRPLINLSFAVNHALGGMNVWGYHAVNLVIHILAALTLFGIMRRTPIGKFRNEIPVASLGTKFEIRNLYAFAIALIWALHPLQTEAVTYISERAESLMGLFYLLTLYCFIRSVDENKFGFRSSKFEILSVAACFLGIATKEVMVTAPVIVLLYDRTFVSGSFAEAWKRRSRYYAGLASSWLLLGFLLRDVGKRGVGFDQGVNGWTYALTESRVVLRYLGLAVWPHPLIFDYGVGTDQPTWAVTPYLAGALLLLAGTGWALTTKFRSSKFEIRNLRALGFAGAWFFLILAPTSSVVAVAGQPMAEHRMYLPLAAVIAVVVCGGYALLAATIQSPLRSGSAILVLVAVACGCLTARRNEDYRTTLSLWSKTAEERPLNPRAQYNLGLSLNDAGDKSAAMDRYRQALQIKPDYPDAHNNLGIALADTGRWTEAVVEYKEAIRLAPGFDKPLYNLGNAFSHLGMLPDAIASYDEAVRISPDNPDFNYNLGNALRRLGNLPAAGAHYEQALRVKPDFPKARNNLGNIRRDTGNLPEAIRQYQEALRLKPDYVEALLNLAETYAALGRQAEALSGYEAALRLEPNNVEALDNLGASLAQSGQVVRAADKFKAASLLEPGNPEIHFNLGCALAQQGRIAEARIQFEEVLRLAPNDAEAQAHLAKLPNF